jgi:hypothetical protein
MAINDVGGVKETEKPTNIPIIVGDSDYSSILEVGETAFMDAAYNGTGGFKTGRYLIPFNSEVRSMFERRKQLAFLKNYLNPIIRATIDPVMNAEIKREIVVNGAEVKDGLRANEFLKNATGNGQPLQAFVDRVLTKGSVHGVAYAVLDNVPKADQPATVAEAIRLRKFPFVYLRSCDQVQACGRDNMLRLTWIRFIEASTKDEKGNEVKNFLYYDSTTIQKQKQLKGEKEGAFITTETINHGLGQIPVIVDYYEDQESTEKDNIKMQPPFYDVAKINYLIFNKDSIIIDQERKQGKGMLYMQETAPGNFTFGANNYISVEPTMMAPGVVSFPPDLLRVLVENNEKLAQDLFRIAGQLGINIHASQVKSGDAYAWEYRAEERNLKRTARRAKNLEEQIMILFAKFANESFKYHCEYPETFRPDSESDELTDLDKLLLMIDTTQGKVRRLIQKQAFMIKAKDWPEAEVTEVITDFDEPAPDTQPPPIAGQNGNAGGQGDGGVADVGAGAVGPIAVGAGEPPARAK